MVGTRHMVSAYKLDLDGTTNTPVYSLERNITMSPFGIPKVLKGATKILKIVIQIKILCQKIIMNRAFSIVKMSAREALFSRKKI